MKKIRKSIIVCSVLALGFAVAGGAAFKTNVLNNITASAATATVASFEVSDGASVRIATNSNGIRFETKISDAYYEALQTEFSTGTFTFYTVINRAENPVKEDAEVYEHTVNANSFVDGYATYYSAIKYDNLTPDQLKVASAIELKATAYVDIAVDGSATVTREATANDTARSMRTVANLALLSGDYANNSTAITQLKTYLGEVTRNEEVVYFETSATTKTLTLKNATAGMDVYLNGKNTGLTTGVNGVVDYSSLDLSDYMLGDYLYVSAFNSDNDVVSTKVRYVTQAIETETEFRAVCNEIRTNNYADRYYVLANNIDCTDTTLLGGAEAWGNLSASFDGQGYYVNNLYVGEWGIFGVNVNNGGTLKNIAFTNVNSTVENPVLFGTGGKSNIVGQISNVYVSAACEGLTLYKNAQGSLKSMGYFNAVVLENCAGVYAGNSNETGTISTNSLYMISETEMSVAADRYATNTMKADVNKYEYLVSNTKYGGIYWYATYELMKDANISLTAVAGQPTIAPFNDCWDLTEGYPVWRKLPAEVITITEKQYVEQPTAEYGTSTAAGYSALAISGVQDETVSVSINGGEAITLNVAAGAVQIPWTAFASAGVTLGQTVPMLVKASDGTTWIFNNVMYVTQAIETEEEFRAFSVAVSKASYDGRYFVLANNIECTSTTDLGTEQHWNNFTSTLDGQGYYVNKLYVGEYGFIGGRFGQEKSHGTIKNIAFTNVNSHATTPRLITYEWPNKVHGHLDNIYVSAACEGLTLYESVGSLTQNPVMLNAVILENCAGVFRGNGHSGEYFLCTNSVYMISAEETPVALGNSLYATNSTQEGVTKCAYSTDAKRGAMYWYASYELMKAEVKATATANAPTIAPFNDCWDLTNGYPVWKNLPKA